MKYGIRLSVKHLPSSEHSAHRKTFRASEYKKEALAEYETEAEAAKVVEKLNADQESFKFSLTYFESLGEIGLIF